MANQKINAELLKKPRIGVEIEMGRISKQKAMQIVDYYFNGDNSTGYYDGRHHDNYVCLDNTGRKWQFMDDASASGDWGCITCEMVTPILTYDDIPRLQDIVRLLRQAGAQSGAHYNAGVHIHIDVPRNEDGDINCKAVRNLVNLIASHERFLCQAIAITPSRQAQWAQFVEPNFLRLLNRRKPKTADELGALWYGGEYEFRHGCRSHYNSTRYHLLNLHAIWDKGTIEFRCFEFHNSLHAGELKAWIQLCLAMVSYSTIVSYCSPKQINVTNGKYQFRSWLLNMGLIGDEFKTCRKLLLRRLPGDTGYKNGRPGSNDDDIDDLTLAME